MKRYKLPYTEEDIIELNGPWDLGYALSLHSISSTVIDSSRNIFDTKRTKLGSWVYLFKYGERIEFAEPLSYCLTVAIKNLILQKDHNIQVITTPPPTEMHRQYQPIKLIAEGVSNYLKIPFKILIGKDPDCKLTKNMNMKISKVKYLKEKIHCRYAKLNSKEILIIDDIYGSGATLEVCTDILRGKGCTKIYIMTLTKKRR